MHENGIKWYKMGLDRIIQFCNLSSRVFVLTCFNHWYRSYIDVKRRDDEDDKMDVFDNGTSIDCRCNLRWCLVADHDGPGVAWSSEGFWRLSDADAVPAFVDLWLQFLPFGSLVCRTYREVCGQILPRLDVSLGFGQCAWVAYIWHSCWHSPPDQWAWDHFKSRWDESRRHEDWRCNKPM